MSQIQTQETIPDIKGDPRYLIIDGEFYSSETVFVALARANGMNQQREPIHYLANGRLYFHVDDREEAQLLWEAYTSGDDSVCIPMSRARGAFFFLPRLRKFVNTWLHGGHLPHYTSI